VLLHGTIGTPALDQAIDHEKTDIVPSRLVPGTGIAETDYQFHLICLMA
jgi:hypothetical protein